MTSGIKGLRAGPFATVKHRKNVDPHTKAAARRRVARDARARAVAEAHRPARRKAADRSPLLVGLAVVLTAALGTFWLWMQPVRHGLMGARADGGVS